MGEVTLVIQWFKKTKPKCRCEADKTQVTRPITMLRGNPKRKKTSRMVRHYRVRDGAHFWHWEDQSRNLVTD